MFCTNCGKEIEDTWVKCPYCGTAVKSSTNEKGNVNSENYNNFVENEEHEESISRHMPEYPIGNTDKIRYRSFWKYLLLSCITCGIYGLYVMYGYVEDLNKVCEGDGKKSKNIIVVILLSIVTCGIYGLYWYYVQGERLHQIAPKYGIQIREKGSTFLLWFILGVFTSGLTSLVVTYIMFDNLNLLGSIYNGEKTADEIRNAGKPHPHLLRNVLLTCTVILAIIIGSIILMMASLSTDNTSEDISNSSVLDETVEEYSDQDISADVSNSLVPEEMVEDYSDIDLEVYIGQPEETLQELGIEGDEYGEYSALDDTFNISCIDGMVYMIILQGTDTNTPAFHGIKTGMNLSDAEMLLADVYVPAGQVDNRTAYLNMDTGVSIGLETSGEKITRLIVMKMSQEEIDSYMKEVFVFPDSDKKYLSEDEVRSVEVDRLAIGRNEIFARHGYIFGEDIYRQYFESMPWYKGTVPADQFNGDAVFNDFEKKNAELIKKIEDEISRAAEEQAAIDGAYYAIAGKTFQKQDAQMRIKFKEGGEFVSIGYYSTWPEFINKYASYSVTARYEVYRDDQKEWLTYVNIEGVEYYLRYFADGSINLAGYGEFDGWYDITDDTSE